VWALVLAGAIGFSATTSVVLYRGAVAAGLGRGRSTAVAAGAAAGLGGWLVLTGALARAGAYEGQAGRPWFVLAFAGFLTALLLATRIPPVSRVLADPGTAARLTVPHALRVVGVVFLLVMARGALPAAFALPAGLGDVAVGVAAPFVAWRLARSPGRAGAAAGAVRFHALGLLDLAVALSLGFLLGTPLLLGGTPSTDALRLLPLALVPTGAVPLAIALHLVALRRLRPAGARVEAPDSTGTWHPASPPGQARA
jgi:hypothetical protein